MPFDSGHVLALRVFPENDLPARGILATGRAVFEILDPAECGLAAAALLRPPQVSQLSGHTEQMILNSAYLVDNERSGKFSAAVQSLADRHPGVRVEFSGPWPPYWFAAIEEEAGPDSGAEAPGRASGRRRTGSTPSKQEPEQNGGVL